MTNSQQIAQLRKEIAVLAAQDTISFMDQIKALIVAAECLANNASAYGNGLSNEARLIASELDQRLLTINAIVNKQDPVGG